MPALSVKISFIPVSGGVFGMLGIIDVGGGMRGIYGAAVFDWLMMNEDIQFDFLVGVSAGSTNIASYLSKQIRRNYKFFTEISFRKEYMSLGNFIKKGSYIDFDYVYSDKIIGKDGEVPFDFDEMKRTDKIFRIVATDAETGEPVYYDLSDITDHDYSVFRGSSSLPVVNKPTMFRGRTLYDGGVSDPIPYRYAMEQGCDRLVIILTRPKDYFRDGKDDRRLSVFLKKKYPKIAEAMNRRAEVYNNELRDILELEKEGRAVIIAPDSIGEMGTLKKDVRSLNVMYQKGLRDAELLIPDFVKAKE